MSGEFTKCPAKTDLQKLENWIENLISTSQTLDEIKIHIQIWKDLKNAHLVGYLMHRTDLFLNKVALREAVYYIKFPGCGLSTTILYSFSLNLEGASSAVRAVPTMSALK